MSNLKVIHGKRSIPSEAKRAHGLLDLENDVCELKRRGEFVLLATDGDDADLLPFAAEELAQRIERFKKRYYQALHGEELSASFRRPAGRPACPASGIANLRHGL
jgi:hypothetical protein